ncbi:monocarboxylate transporter 12-like [Glandiceps talaboti]
MPTQTPSSVVNDNYEPTATSTDDDNDDNEANTSSVTADKRDNIPPDGGWGWFVVAGSFLVNALSTGALFSFSVLFVAFLGAFNKSKADTAWTGSIAIFIFKIGGPISIAVSRRLGYRTTTFLGGLLACTGLLLSSYATNLTHLYITYGILTGCGAGLAYLPCIEIVGLYFKKRLSLALGLAMAGSGAGQFVLSVVTQQLVDTYGWRATLMILSAVTAHISVAGALLRPLGKNHPVRILTNRFSKTNRVEYPENEQRGCAIREHDTTKCPLDLSNEKLSAELENTNKEIDKSESGDISCSESLTRPTSDAKGNNRRLSKSKCQACFNACVRRALDFGMSSTHSSLIPAVMGLSQMVGRPLFGAVGNLSKVKPYMLYSYAMAQCGIFTIVSIYTRSFTGQFIYAIIFGMGLGGYIIHIPLVVAHFLDPSKLAAGSSFIFQVHGITVIILSPFSGCMRDVSGDYNGAFWLSGSALIVGAVFAILLPVFDRTIKRRKANKGYEMVEKYELKPDERKEVLLVAECTSSL